MTTIRPGLARRLDAAAFAVAMLGFCWWLHAAIGVLAWLIRRQPAASLLVLAVQALVGLLVVLGVPVFVGPRAFRVVRVVLRGVTRLVLLLGGRPRRRALLPASRRQATGGIR